MAPALTWMNAATAQPGPPSSPSAALRDAEPAAGKPASADAEEAARSLVKQGREALKAGDKARAEMLARQALALKVPVKPSWDDSPEKLLADCGVKAPTGPAAKPPA